MPDASGVETLQQVLCCANSPVLAIIGHSAPPCQPLKRVSNGFLCDTSAYKLQLDGSRGAPGKLCENHTVLLCGNEAAGTTSCHHNLLRIQVVFSMELSRER